MFKGMVPTWAKLRGETHLASHTLMEGIMLIAYGRGGYHTVRSERRCG